MEIEKNKRKQSERKGSSEGHIYRERGTGKEKVVVKAKRRQRREKRKPYERQGEEAEAGSEKVAGKLRRNRE